MKRLVLVIGLFCFFTVSVRSQQVDCATMGFESGSALGWVLTSGTINAANQRVNYLNEVMLTVENGHLVTNVTDGNDPKITTEKIPMVAPGSKHSIRIGNTMHGGTFDRIKTSFLVTPDNTLFQYQFAVVLQNDNTHSDFQKPGFNIQIEDSDGQELACNKFDIQLQRGATAEGFKVQGDLEYKNWTTGAIDLRNYIGRIINIEVTAHGCTERRHFGYAYFVANASKLRAVKVNDVEPNQANVDANKYSVARPLFVYSSAKIMKDKPQVAAFINFYIVNVDRALKKVSYFPAPSTEVNIAKANWISAMK